MFKKIPVTATVLTKCPGCGRQIHKGEVCLYCGYHLGTGGSDNSNESEETTQEGELRDDSLEHSQGQDLHDSNN